MSVTVIISLLSQLLSLVPQGTALYQKYEAQKQQAEQWQATGYTPTDADWAAMNAQITSDEAAIDAAANR
jgi:hypothetical protein